MELSHREALSALRLTWAPTADDLWHSQGALHVRGLHDRPMADVMAAFGDAERETDSSPLGVVVRGPAGSGKTHLLGQVREQVQTGGGFFFLVELLDVLPGRVARRGQFLAIRARASWRAWDGRAANGRPSSKICCGNCPRWRTSRGPIAAP